MNEKRRERNEVLPGSTSDADTGYAKPDPPDEIIGPDAEWAVVDIRTGKIVFVIYPDTQGDSEEIT